MVKKIINRFLNSPKDFILFLFALSILGFSQSIFDSTFNNYLNETFSIKSIDRAILELPRELPGFLVIFVSTILFFIGSRRVAALANLLSSIGLILICFFSFSFNIMLIWLFIFSTGQHLFLPLNSSIGMELARKGEDGKRLGQLNSANNFFAILGSFIIFIGFRFFNFNFKISLLIAATGYAIVSLLIYLMTPDNRSSIKGRFVIRKKYSLYYILTILFGTRKQIFLTFAPWVLVSIFHQKTEIIATLLTIGGIIGIFFKPILGKAIDKLGEKKILCTESIILIFVCIGYGFSQFVFSEKIALLIIFLCYILDQLLMSFGMARATYLKKIAISKEEISSTLTMGTSIDHIFSITIALTGGIIWKIWGYQYIFLIGSIIALINLFFTLKIKINNNI